MNATMIMIIKRRLVTIYSQTIILLQKQVKRLQRQIEIRTAVNKNEIIYNVAKSFLGKRFITIDPELACANALDIVWLEATGKKVGGTNSTLRMYNILRKSKEFSLVGIPSPGVLVISPTGFGNGQVEHGHVGIIGDNGAIMSNNSWNGLWDTYWTLEKWKAHYGGKGGFPVRFFELS